MPESCVELSVSVVAVLGLGVGRSYHCELYAALGVSSRDRAGGDASALGAGELPALAGRT